MAKKDKTPVAFLSYVRHLDDNDGGNISKLAERLSAEVEIQTGIPFPIFQDRNDIKWGQNWKEVLDTSIDTVAFLIPVISPQYFISEACRDELEKFLAKEKKLNRNDLVLPIYYVTTPAIEKDEKRKDDELAQAVVEHQFINWRPLRFEPLGKPEISKAIANMAEQIAEAIERVNTKTRLTTKISPTIKNDSSTADIETSKSISIKADTKEPKILIVDPMHRGDYTTVSEAIANATPGTRIIVKSGLYNESLLIDKPLEIIGDGDKNQVTIQIKDKSVISFKTSMGLISNLTLRQLGGKHGCIQINQGKLNIEQCNITSLGYAAISISNWADPRIRRSKVYSHNEPGILIFNNGMGTIEENEIYNCGLAGIEIKNNSSPHIRDNIITNCEGGIFIHEQSSPTVENNTIYNNRLSAILITGKSNPTIIKNELRNNAQSGLYIYENGGGLINNNNIHDNLLEGICISSSESFFVKSNIINKNNRYGIRIIEKSEGFFEDNEILDNLLGAWDISEKAKKTIKILTNTKK